MAEHDQILADNFQNSPVPFPNKMQDTYPRPYKRTD